MRLSKVVLRNEAAEVDERFVCHKRNSKSRTERRRRLSVLASPRRLCLASSFLCPSAALSLSAQALHTTDIMPAQSTEQSFRDNLSQFRWARGNNDDSQQQQQQNASTGSNPFSRFYNAIGNGYVPLRSNERSNEEEAYFALSRWERCVRHCCGTSAVCADSVCGRLRWCLRLLGFEAGFIGVAVRFFVAFLTVPLIAFRPAKFALSFRCALPFR